MSHLLDGFVILPEQPGEKASGHLGTRKEGRKEGRKVGRKEGRMEGRKEGR